jgi:uncharacterized protein involved in tolerance to divalent cations
MEMQKFVDECIDQYATAAKAHEDQIRQMQQEYEDMVKNASAKMEALIASPQEVVEEPVKTPSITKIETDDGETHYVFNQQAFDQNNAIMDGMSAILQEL